MKLSIRNADPQWLLSQLNSPKKTSYRIFHAILNYTLSILGLLFVFLPLLPLLAILIKLDSKGPVFFRHRRFGKNGNFDLLKFRTMQQGSQHGLIWTVKDDQRITHLGQWLRKFRIDELPQLINVLKGEMSLIGPRPEPESLMRDLNKKVPFYEYRYLVLPGITGWAQVNHGHTSSVDGAFEKLQYDLYWIKNRSFLLDLKIILKSFRVVFTGFGAEPPHPPAHSSS